jgi:Fur family transcriptional regulator, zinc uptake regulator
MTVFPSPNHDHARCTDLIVRQAEAICRRRGARLTAQRARVLEVLAQDHRPMGAYEIMDALAEHGRRPAPITIYRALDFLVEQGLAHRIESRNAFIACMAGETDHETAVFLICRHCGNVGETVPSGLREALDAAAAAQGFAPDFTVIEIDGICRHCADRLQGKPS